MRTNLKVLRVKKDMTQADMANRIGVTRACYAYIEAGERRGGQKFWNTLQKEFAIADEEMWALMKNE